MRKRFFQMAEDDMNKEKADIFDHDLTQAILLNLHIVSKPLRQFLGQTPKTILKNFQSKSSLRTDKCNNINVPALYITRKVQ